MVAELPENVKAIWERCNLRGSITLSLSLQVFLIFLAPRRKRSSSNFLAFLVWFAYLLADFVALFTLGLISTKQSQALGGRRHNDDLLALWAPFCLIHLGGPDTITAYSIQDGSLWLRHLLALFIHVLVALYVFVESLPDNSLWVPTSLLFVTGIVKYAERNRALYLANFAGYKGDPGVNYAKLMQEYAARLAARLPARIEMYAHQRGRSAVSRFAEGGEHVTCTEAVFHAFHFFSVFTNLIVDQLVLQAHSVKESWSYFRHGNAEDAYRVVSIELGFFYQVLYTKALTIYCKVGCVFRTVSFTAMAVSLSFFALSRKRGFHSVDVGITYLLYGSAVGLEAAALLMLVCSDWAVVAVRSKINESRLCQILNNYLENIKEKPCFSIRWSESVYGFNLIEYCLREVSRQSKSNVLNQYRHKFSHKAIYFLGLREFFEARYVTKTPLDKELWSFIFTETERKSNGEFDLESLKLMSSAVIRDWINLIDNDLIRAYSLDKDYDESLLLWHVATELCFLFGPADHNNLKKQGFSKTLSDYMLYLLLMQPTLMSPVAGIGRRWFVDTCAEAKHFFAHYGLSTPSAACKRVMKVNTEIKPSIVKGNKSKSVLFEACALAKELNKMGEADRWDLVSRVWVELLSFAACGCRPKPHAELLSTGGELVTHVWLLLVHFGIYRQLYVTDNNATAKLFVTP